MSSALDTQVAGSHYKDNFKMQPVELITLCNWNFIQGNIAKYVLRAKYKNGQQDLDKAIHYCKLGNQLDEESGRGVVPGHRKFIDLFARINEIDSHLHSILFSIDAKNYNIAEIEIAEIQIVEK